MVCKGLPMFNGYLCQEVALMVWNFQVEQSKGEVLI